MLNKQHSPPGKLLGAGRSGRVFLVDGEDSLIARKVFYTDKLAGIIQYILLGAVNPYIWNEDAIKCAFYRRKILRILVEYWFGGKLKVAEAKATRWNRQFKAYQMDTEFISGRHVGLRQPCSREQVGEFSALVDDIMLPLQQKLIAAGLDGLVWQAGKGTPTALNNFLLVNGTEGKNVFAWIDLESGVPALFPLNPVALFCFYLPRCFQYGRPLFDDVNIPRLREYLGDNQTKIEDMVGIHKYHQIVEDVNLLEYHQQQWKSMGRVDSSISYQLKTGIINQQQAQWYSRHPLLWYGRELLRIIRKFMYWMFLKLPPILMSKVIQIPYLRIIYKFGKFITSHRYRIYIARNYITSRILSWKERKQLPHAEAVNLIQHLQQDSSSEYLNDFGVHIGIKIFIKSLEYLVVPFLYLVGLIDELILITWLIVGGPIYRTTYTIWRTLQAGFTGKDIPWIALIIGLIPTVGTMAYPCQIIYSAKGRKRKIAQFIIYDFFTRIGKKIPIWGGEDTHTEHFFNRLADQLATTNYQPEVQLAKQKERTKSSPLN